MLIRPQDIPRPSKIAVPDVDTVCCVFDAVAVQSPVSAAIPAMELLTSIVRDCATQVAPVT